MSKINGTALLVYADGEVIAAQKSFTFGVSQSVRDATNKESGGWAEHENGMRSATVSVEGLLSSTGLSAKGLIDYILSRKSLLLVISGLAYDWVMEADLSDFNLTAGQEETATISGTMTVKGRPYYLSGANANLITDPDAGGTDYDTLTPSGIRIASAINAAGNAYCNSNTISVTSGDIIKLFVHVKKTSGQLPTVGIWDNMSAYISGQEALVEGFNLVTLIATGTDASASLRWSNSDAANWSTSNIYLFKDN